MVTTEVTAVGLASYLLALLAPASVEAIDYDHVAELLVDQYGEDQPNDPFISIATAFSEMPLSVDQAKKACELLQGLARSVLVFNACEGSVWSSEVIDAI